MFVDPSGFPQTMMSRGRIPNAYNTPVMYPSPFFDLGHTYLPKTLNEMFRWCKYYFMTNSVIHSIVTKLATYPITEIIVEAEQDGQRKRWEHFLHNQIKIRPFQVGAGLDYHTYGNCLISISFPFTKVLGCPDCGWYEHIGNANYRYQGFEFHIKCKNCGNRNRADVKDIYVRAADKIRLLRWNPENVDIEPGYGDKSVYHVRLSQQLLNDLVAGRKDVVANTPQIFIDAAKEKRAVAISSDNVYHMKRSSISSDYEGWGVSRIMAVLKDAFLCQLMKKATEVLLTEHVVPLRILFPTVAGPSQDPYQYANLARWKENVNMELAYWRWDPNRIPVFNLPLGHMTVGGDGKALLLIQDIQVMYELMAVGMGVPREFLFGGLSYSGSSVSMRMLENDFLRYTEDQQGFLNWVITRTAYYMGWPMVKAKHKQFKMADDLNRLGMALQMRQLGDLSRHDMHVQAGFDPEVTNELLKKERMTQREEAKSQAQAQAEAQGELLLTQARYEVKAMQLRERMMAESGIQAPMTQPGGGVQQEAPAMAAPGTFVNDLQGGPGLEVNQGLLESDGSPAAVVGYDLRELVPQLVRSLRQDPSKAPELMQRLQAAYPEVYRQIAAELNPTEPVQALPEQRPPRREAGRALI